MIAYVLVVLAACCLAGAKMSPDNSAVLCALALVFIITAVVCASTKTYAKNAAMTKMDSAYKKFKANVTKNKVKILTAPTPVASGEYGCFPDNSFNVATYQSDVNNAWDDFNAIVFQLSPNQDPQNLPVLLRDLYDAALAIYADFDQNVNAFAEINGNMYRAPFGNLYCSDYCGSTNSGAVYNSNTNTCSCTDEYSYTVSNTVNVPTNPPTTTHYVTCTQSAVKTGYDNFRANYDSVNTVAVQPSYSGVCGSSSVPGGVNC